MRHRRLRLGRLFLFLLVAVTLQTGQAAYSEQPSLKSQLIGSWSFVLTASHRKDGTSVDIFGPSPNRILMFHPDGHFVLMNTRPGRAKYVSGNRAQGTPEEFRDTALGSIAYFGVYSVDEDKRTFVLKIKGSTFPNYEGTDQVRPFTIAGDELRSINPNPSQGGPPLDLVLKRMPKIE